MFEADTFAPVAAVPRVFERPVAEFVAHNDALANYSITLKSLGKSSGRRKRHQSSQNQRSRSKSFHFRFSFRRVAGFFVRSRFHCYGRVESKEAATGEAGLTRRLESFHGFEGRLNAWPTSNRSTISSVSCFSFSCSLPVATLANPS